VNETVGGKAPDRIPAWRIGAGVGVLAALLLISIRLAPVYLSNLELEKFLRERPPASDELLRQAIINRGHLLGLDIVPDHLDIRRSSAGGRNQVRYIVRVGLPLYTVDLHFSSNIPAAGQ
jgi:hypothetical protein